MDAILNAMRREINRSRGNASTQHGLITSYDQARFAVKVSLQPSGKDTGWLPLGSPWIGNGWGMFFAPSIGDQIVVEFQEGSGEVPVAMLRLFDNQNVPLSVPSGEMWMVHQSGSYIKLTNDGKITLNAATEIDVGHLGSTLHTLVTDAFMGLYNGHVHTNGNSGANTGTPFTPMSSAQLTTVLNAN